LQCQRRYRWRLHLDISAYFLSVNHARLLALLAKCIVDADTLQLLQWILHSGGEV
jgi:retron-type reverse transcriptase